MYLFLVLIIQPVCLYTFLQVAYCEIVSEHFFSVSFSVSKQIRYTIILCVCIVLPKNLKNKLLCFISEEKQLLTEKRKLN